ncbi:MAG: branched-chain amino acid ABC transporter permease [Caldimonas sp.]
MSGRFGATWRESPARSRLALLALVVVLALVPLVADRYLLTTLILILSLAYVGQAWNIMMGFAGQLSLGHALYVGLGAYTAAALFQHFAITPWIGMIVAVGVCVAAATFIGWLAFRFGISGTYFALLTIAFAEFTRIGFDHFAWVGGSAGFFIRVASGGTRDWANLRGGPLMFYYVALALAVFAFVLSAWLLRGRAGYYFRAIRDNEDAARAAGIDTFRYKLYAVQISGGLTGLAGVFYAFYYSNLFPEQIFNISRSIEIVLVPIIGGIGTLFGPVLGAAILTVLSESLNAALAAVGVDVPGVKLVLYGIVLGGAIMFMPHGVWPGIARRLGFDRRRDDATAGPAGDATSGAADTVRSDAPRSRDA